MAGPCISKEGSHSSTRCLIEFGGIRKMANITTSIGLGNKSEKSEYNVNTLKKEIKFSITLFNCYVKI